MDETSFTAMDTASAILALSKAAWRLGLSISKLDQDTKIVDTSLKYLAGDVKSLGNECDLVYAELEEGVRKSEKTSSLPDNVESKIWKCLATQVKETCQTMQELESFVRCFKEESTFVNQTQRQRKLDENREQITSIRIKIRRHTNNLCTVLLLINT